MDNYKSEWPFVQHQGNDHEFVIVPDVHGRLDFSPRFCWECGTPIRRGDNYPVSYGSGNPDAVFYSVGDVVCGIERRCLPCAGEGVVRRNFRHDLKKNETRIGEFDV